MNLVSERTKPILTWYSINYGPSTESKNLKLGLGICVNLIFSILMYVLDVLCGALINLVHSANFMDNLVTTLVSSISLPVISALNIYDGISSLIYLFKCLLCSPHVARWLDVLWCKQIIEKWFLCLHGLVIAKSNFWKSADQFSAEIDQLILGN